MRNRSRLFLVCLAIIMLVSMGTGCKKNKADVGELILNYDEQAEETFKTYFRYKFVNVATDLAMAAFDIQSDTVVSESTGNEIDNRQLWRIEKDKKGGYYIKNAYSNKRLAVKKYSEVIIRAGVTSKTEEVSWKIEKVDNYYVIKQSDEKVLEGKKSSVDISVSKNTTAQQWKIFEVQEFEDLGAYKILSGKKAITGSREKTIALQKYEANYFQQWFFQRNQNGLYTITNIGSCYTLQEIDGKLVLDAPTDEKPEWHIERLSLNTFQITNYRTKDVLVIQDGRLTIVDPSHKPEALKIMFVQYNYPVPVPNSVDTGNYEVIMGRCDLWSLPENWNPIKGYLSKKPLLGWYDEGCPVVSDWEINMMIEAGVSVTLSSWYRTTASFQAGTVEEIYTDYLNNHKFTQYGDLLPFIMMWENTAREENDVITCIARNKDEFINTYVKYWIENIFTMKNYYTVDHKIVMAMFKPDEFIEQVGGVESAKQCLAVLRQEVKKAGWEDVIIFGQWCFGDEKYSKKVQKEIGFDYSFSYNLPIHSGYVSTYDVTSELCSKLMEEYWYDHDNNLGYIASISVGWDYECWGGTDKIKYERQWRFSPQEFLNQLNVAKKFMKQKKTNDLSKKWVYIDCWNEYGEGHSVMPDVREGFAYLEKLKAAFVK